MKRVSCLVAALVVLGSSPALAAFPGRNGAIVVGYKASLQDTRNTSWEERSIRLRSLDSPDQMLYGCRDASSECAAQSYTDPAFAPSGRLVVFDAGVSLALVNVDGSGFRQLPAHSRDDGQPAFSLTGGRLVFVVHGNGSRETSIWTCDADDGGNARLLVRDGAQPVWSTRNWIAFVRTGGIYRVRPDGSGLRRLTRDGSAPAWSPDGRRLAFTRGGVHRARTSPRPGGLFIMAANGANAHRLPQQTITYGVQDLAWSPDGRRLLAYPESIVALGLRGRLLRSYGWGDNIGGEFSSRDYGLDWQPLP